MSATVIGPLMWGGQRNQDGDREYVVRYEIKASSAGVGPASIMQASGLPAIGSSWSFPSDTDDWAFCTPEIKVAQKNHKEGEPHLWWYADVKFSTLAFNRCQDQSIEDPLLEPDRVSGTFVKFTEEATRDRNGDPIMSSSFEMFRGPAVEFDNSRATVHIEQNRATLELATFSYMIDTVNSSPLWGLAARKVKLSNVAWERKVYGQCCFYYTRSLDFDVCNKPNDSFDRDLLDEGNKVLNGRHRLPTDSGTADGWVLIDIDGAPPDPNNPRHFIRYTDIKGDPAKCILNGAGIPLEDGDAPFYHHVEKYPESNFLLLGIPTSF
jgi:hypothetical protein